MKKILSMALAALLLVGTLGGCSTSGGENGKLVLYTWENMFPQEVLDGFTQETGISVTYSNFDTDETMLARLEAAEGGDYDLVIHHRDCHPGGAGPRAGHLQAGELRQHQPRVPGAVL